MFCRVDGKPKILTKADKLMSKLQRRAHMQQFVQIPELPTDLPKGGLESRKPTEQLEALTLVLNEQANIVDEWREKVIQFLIQPLVDEDDDVEITGEEYGELYLSTTTLPPSHRHECRFLRAFPRFS